MKVFASLIFFLGFSSSGWAQVSDADLAKLRERVIAKYPEKAPQMIAQCKEGLASGEIDPKEKPKDADAFCACLSKRGFEKSADLYIEAIRKKIPAKDRPDFFSKGMEEGGPQIETECSK